MVGRRARGIAAYVVGAGLLGAGCGHAACLVLEGGVNLEVRTPPQVRGALVVFEDRNGRLVSLRRLEVDTAATAEANRRGVCVGDRAGKPAVSPLRDTPRPVEIRAPTGDVHSPTASDILGAMAPAVAGRRIGPPRGLSIDCRTVECGKQAEAPPPPQKKSKRAVVAPTGSATATSAPQSSSSPSPAGALPPAGQIFGAPFAWQQTPETSPPPRPPPTRRRKPPRGG